MSLSLQPGPDVAIIAPTGADGFKPSLKAAFPQHRGKEWNNFTPILVRLIHDTYDSLNHGAFVRGQQAVAWGANMKYLCGRSTQRGADMRYISEMPFYDMRCQYMLRLWGLLKCVDTSCRWNTHIWEVPLWVTNMKGQYEASMRVVSEIQKWRIQYEVPIWEVPIWVADMRGVNMSVADISVKKVELLAAAELPQCTAQPACEHE